MKKNCNRSQLYTLAKLFGRELVSNRKKPVSLARFNICGCSIFVTKTGHCNDRPRDGKDRSPNLAILANILETMEVQGVLWRKLG